MIKRLLVTIWPALLILAAPPVMLYTVWINPTSAAEDDVTYVYPMRVMVAQALREGRWPVQNDLEATGAPLLADPQAGVFFPPNWLFVPLEGHLAYSLCIFAAFSMAGWGTYLYLRRLGMVRGAATFGALAFMFCGFMVGHRVHLPMIQTAGLFPWGLWCIELAAGGALAGLVAFVPVAVLAIAAGHWAILTYMALAWAVYAVLRRRSTLRSLAVLAAGGAMAVAILWPQVQATFELMSHATRKGIGYAIVGENSFFPISVLLALYPMIMGSQTPNFFPQQWWGSWHLSEMLCYGGLVSLVLAGAAVWSLYRKGGARNGADGAAGPPAACRWRPVVRVWTWLAIGSAIWMMGYYLPTYRLIYMLPVFNVVRCPVRMLLVVNMAAAVLAAVAVDVLLTGGPEGQRLRRAILHGATRVLPAAMLGAWALLAGAAAIAWACSFTIPFPFTGAVADVLVAVRPGNPAVWVPLALTAATILVVRWWLASPQKRQALLVALLLADLFFITRFVDVPAGLLGKGGGSDPGVSPAAQWLHQNAPGDAPYITFGLTRGYRDRPNELLQPRVGQGLGIATLGSYGAWHNPMHAHLFGFNTYGRCRDWAALIRRNHLLSLYGVKYVLAARREFCDVIESVRIAESPSPEGGNLLGDQWELDDARQEGEVIRLQTPFSWRWSKAVQPVEIEGGGVYRISLDARGPEGGAAHFLRAEIFKPLSDGKYIQADALGLTVIDERIGSTWRHFEWTFEAPASVAGPCQFRLFSMGERLVEVRHIELCKSHWETPINLGGQLAVGEKVYRRVALLPPVYPADDSVAIYENLLCRPGVTKVPPSEAGIEQLRWVGDDQAAAAAVPDIALRLSNRVGPALWRWTLPAGVAYIVIVCTTLGRAARQKIRRGD
ncbi:MAG: hypothetical protein WC869_07260 [Phycisphaerae bacterium]|jgi:hypothetical protein